MQDLNGKTALITGASSGIGEALALELARDGVRLALAGRNAGRLEATAARVRAIGAAAHVYAADLARPGDAESLAAAVESDLGDTAILAHSAGALKLGRVDACPAGDFDELFRINVLAPYVLTRCLLPALRRRHGDIVFVNSRVALGARPELVPYSATKAALKSVADGLRAECSRDGVRVISIYPARVATPMQEYVHAERDQAYDASRWISAAEVALVIANALRMPAHFEVADVVVRGSNDSPS